MVEFSGLGIEAALAAFVVCGAVIGVVGTRIARSADALADATGWGEAIFGAIFLGASTSLPGIVASTSAALDGHADLAFSNALGGIAAQTVFLAIADLFYPRANLEHAAASVPNMMQGALLIILLMAVILLMTAPDVSVGHVHPGSVILVIVYAFGVRMIAASRQASTWSAARTAETVVDKPPRSVRLSSHKRARQWIVFTIFAALLAVAGHVVARSGAVISNETGLSETIVGGLLMAVTTSLPELVTVIAAVRQSALTLAVGNIIGGNTFDVLFVAVADVGYRRGTIYHAVSDRQEFMVAFAAILTAVLLLGLLRREKRGIANIGFESFLLMIIYSGGMVILMRW